MGQGFITRRGSNKKETYNITFTTALNDANNAQPYSDNRSAVKKFDLRAIKNKFSHIYVSGGANGGDTYHRGIFSILENRFLISCSELNEQYWMDTNYIYQYNFAYLGFEIIDDYLILFVQGEPKGSITQNHLFKLEFI